MNIVGIDIGGTKIAFGLIQDGCLKKQSRINTDPAGSFQEKMRELSRGIIEITEGLIIDGIGIGCAGPLDPLKGTIENPYTLPAWQGANPVAFFRKKFSVPVLLDNDVNAALAGIAHFEYPDLKNAVMLTFGTGIGGAVLIDGELFRIGAKRHPELGHIPAGQGEMSCYCGISGCLESQVSGKRFSRMVEEEGYRGLDDYYELLERGDKKALNLAEHVAAIIDQGLMTYKIIFEPDAFVLGGGFMDRFFPWYVKLHNPSVTFSEFYRNRINLIRSEINGDIAVLGAAALMESQLLKQKGN